MRIKRIIKKEETVAAETIDLALLDPLIAKYKDVKGNMIPILQGAQAIYGYLPKVVFEKISSDTNLYLSEMYGVASFYAQFRLKPVGKHVIKVCHGTACHVQNANAITEALSEELKVKDGETTPDGLFTLESVACLGCCSLAPVMMIGENTFGKLTEKETRNVIRKMREAEKGTPCNN